MPKYKSALKTLTLGLSTLALVAGGQVSRADAASITYTATGTNTGFASSTGSSLGASVVFDDLINPGKLTVTLTNTGAGASAPSDVLTSVFWDYNGTAFSGLSLDSASAPIVIGGTPGTNVNLKALNEWKLPNTGNGTTDLPGITQNYGLGTAGLGIFQGGGGQQFNYGIISRFNSSTNNKNFQPSSSQVGTFVQGSATFVLSGLPTSGFDISKIGNIRFQYGTALNEARTTAVNYSSYTPNTPPTPPGGTSSGPKKIPEPATTTALGLFAASALGSRKRKAVAQA